MSSISRWLVLSSVVTALTGCSADDTKPPLSPPHTLGSFGVGYLSFTAVDSSRDDRSLLLDVWYPIDSHQADNGQSATYPLSPIFGLESEIAVEDLAVSERQNQTLLVFSHGYGGINLQSIDLMETLASHGFIVVAPEHTGNAQSSMTDSYDEAASRRVPDVSFVIDTMTNRNRDPLDLFYDRIDEERIGVLGHSFGGMTSIGMASGWAGADADSRVVAIAPISAVIDGDRQADERDGPNAGFTSEQLASVVVPVMLIGGTADTSVPIENNAIGFEKMVSAPRVYKVDISGATHTHFTNVCTIGNLLIEIGFDQENWPNIGANDLIEPYQETCSEDAFPIEEVNRLLNIYVVSFFKLQLLNETGYEEYLTHDYAQSETAIGFSVK